MKKISSFLFLALAISTGLAASAQERKSSEKTTKPKIDREFRYNGNWLVCITQTATPPEDGELPCLHVGALNIRGLFSEVKGRLGKPYQVMEVSKEEKNYIYALNGKGPEHPYLLLNVKDNLIHAIQFTGVACDDPISFSTITLGDPAQKVQEILGPPRNRKIVKEIDGEVWQYTPFSISIEIKNDKVYSVRIWES